jgi:glycine dehydrogenase
MGYGGPHAAYFACKETYKRVIPGRIIGVSKDADGNQALRMALQTREQHIKRDKATSNICTAQALLAVMASMYAVYHGPAGVKKIAKETHGKAVFIKEILHGYGIQIKSNSYFDTISGKIPADKKMSKLKELMVDNNINLRYINDFEFSLSLNEAIDILQINKLLDVFATFLEKEFVGNSHVDWTSYWDLKPELTRNGEILTHEIFSQYHSESKMMSYLKRLENKDLSLVHSMIPLGSCTMKLNAASELIPITMPEFANIHPFAPLDQTVGYLEMINQLEEDLCEITGFDSVSFQPNSGAQGEYAGLMVIKAFHESNGHLGRNIVLIPSSAHGTNPASAVMAGLKVVVVKCDDLGNIDVVDLKEKAELYSNELSALMVTYPSTHGVFEESIIEVTQIIHDNGGQVYMDGANMNAQVGLTNPGNIGADVCHLNLHKTFAIPHGGGGPGVGPIGVAKHLSPFLPTNALIKTGGEHAIKGVSSAPFGSSLILLISYGYIKMLGAKGLRASTENAILNANYIKASLADHYDVLYSGVNGTVAHEMILDCRSFKKTTGVEVADIAKRLIDYGFHAPTVSVPVAGTLMIEPTESEDKDELDRFIDSMIAIRKEIAEIEAGKFDHDNNLLKNAPHTAGMLTADSWELPYSRKQASYPAAHLSTWKYWVPVRRVDNAFGDRNLICSCPSIEEYENMLAN